MKNTEISYTDKMPLRGTITDKEAVLNVREKETSNLLRDCIYTNHESFIEAMNIYFNNLWRKCE